MQTKKYTLVGTWSLLLLLSCGTRVTAQDGAIIDACRYLSDEEAQTRWRPMTSDTAPVRMGVIGERRALLLPCRFAEAVADRSSWDYRTQLDLSSCEGIELDFYCSNPAPITSFSLYFGSGTGWYHAHLEPEGHAGWQTLTIAKSATRVEGEPDGWHQIQTLRLSAWRGEGTNTGFAIANVRRRGVLGQDTWLAIVRPDSLANSSSSADAESRRAADQYGETLRRHFASLGIRAATVSDNDLNPSLLGNVKLLILPYNRTVPPSSLDATRTFLQQGGKILSFYGIPDGLREVTGIGRGPFVKQERPGDFAAIRFRDAAVPGAPAKVLQQSWNLQADQPANPQARVVAEWLDDQDRPTGHPAVVASPNGMVMTHVLLDGDDARKRKMLLAMVGQLVPEAWTSTLADAEKRLGRIGPFIGFDAAVSGIRQHSSSPQVIQDLTEAAQHRDQMKVLAERNRYAEALEEAENGARCLELAFCRAQNPVAGEFRAFWCHDAYGVAGLEWDAAIKILADQGMTAVVPNMLWGGGSFGRSRALPQIGRENQPDPVAACVAACQKYGIEMHLWKVNWNLGHHVPPAFVAQLRREQRLQADRSGNELLWLCPSHPENQRLEIEAMIEAARQYDLHGLHFDYIRYPDAAHCFCDGCRTRFEQKIGSAIGKWPEDVLGNGTSRQAWLDWRRDQITFVVRNVRQQIDQINPHKLAAGKPRVRLSAAVFRQWDSDRDHVGQDWKYWCEQGYLDFVCPMDYTSSDVRFRRWIELQQEWAGKVPVIPGIGVSSSSSRLAPDRVIQQIQLTRDRQTGGFILFNYGREEAETLLPLLGAGMTRR